MVDRTSRTALMIVDELFEKAIQNGDCLECHLRPTIDREGHRHYVTVGGRQGKKWRVSRLVYTTKKGEIPEDLWVLHSCDNPRCINLDHLFLGTPQDNIDDMVNKGRQSFVNPRKDHAFRDDIIKLKAGGLNRIQIANKLGISLSTVHNYLSPKGVYYVGQ